MAKDFSGEKWKEVKFDFDFTNDYRLQISNLGRLRSFNKDSDGNILEGTMINGYRIVRLKFYKERDRKVQARLDNLQQQVYKLSAKHRLQIANKESKKTINETAELLDLVRQNLKKKFADDTRSRTINYHALVHRLVAEYFILNHKPAQTVVAHLDFNKLNNRVSNLKWMTPEENYEHQQKSPYVIKEKKRRKEDVTNNTRVAKLSITKVMLLKKLLNEGKPVRQLVKQFKISDMQVYRIKRGENWSNIQAAK